MPDWQIIAYDIKDPRRLSRLHRMLKKEALALQKSVFAVQKKPTELESFINDVLEIVDTRIDDVRVYPISSPSDIWSLGQQATATESVFLPQPKQGRAKHVGLLQKIKNRLTKKPDQLKKGKGT